MPVVNRRFHCTLANADKAYLTVLQLVRHTARFPWQLPLLPNWHKCGLELLSDHWSKNKTTCFQTYYDVNITAMLLYV